ncbi:hypothetical protein V6N13_076059 [Hibiscus sabdariffa]
MISISGLLIISKMRSWTSLALVLRELEVVYSSVTGEIIRRVRKK